MVFKCNLKNEGKLIKVPVTEDKAVDTDEILKKINASTKVIWLCNPNNPTGTVISAERLKNFVEEIPRYVFIKKFSKNPLIIGSKTALEVIMDDLRNTLSENDISSENIDTFSGFPSKNKFDYYVGLVKKFQSDALIAIGGGRVLDTVKAAGDLLDIPVITIPTIAATCAAWAGLTIQYDDEGSYVCELCI